MTRNCSSGDRPPPEEGVVEEGVGVMLAEKRVDERVSRIEGCYGMSEKECPGV